MILDYFQQHLWQMWAIVCFVCLILELFSGDAFILCFSISALVAMLVSLFVDSFTAQVIVFAVVGVLCLLFVRPALLKVLHRNQPDRPSNAEAIVGREGRVSEAIEAGGFGRVAIDGDDWKAQAVGGAAIDKGQRVRVVAMESIILTVEQC